MPPNDPALDLGKIPPNAVRAFDAGECQIEGHLGSDDQITRVRNALGGNSIRLRIDQTPWIVDQTALVGNSRPLDKAAVFSGDAVLLQYPDGTLSCRLSVCGCPSRQRHRANEGDGEHSG